jgi:amidase
LSSIDRDRQLEELTVDAFHDALRRGALTVAELVDWYLARIQAHDRAGAHIQAVVTINPLARAEAAARDEFLSSRGRLCGPLHGVPVLVKDQAETAGLRTTFGSILFEDYVPESDATVLAKLKDAGAVILAKTAMCDFAAGWFSFSSMNDHTKNPYAPTRESGGSSAGTAAGLAANFGLVGIGEDTGGSIRIPASFNNLFGLRVTTGLISRAGFSPLVHFQDTPGPIGRTVADIAKLLDVIVGYDPRDPFTVAASAAPRIGSYAEAVEAQTPLSSWRIGVLEIAGLSEWIADTSVYAMQSKSDIGQFLAERPRAPVSSFQEIYDSKRFHPLNDLFHDIAAGPDTIDGDVLYLQRRLNQEHFRRLILNIFATHGIDFLALTFPTNTVIGAQAGLPALTIPAGFTGDGLPVGLELLGTPLAETPMLQFARAWERSAEPRKAPAL